MSVFTSFYFGILYFITNFVTKLRIKQVKTKLKRKKMNAEGITYHYQNLERGSKDQFVCAVASALEQSTSNIRYKLRKGNWSRIEVQEVERIIKEGR